MTDSASLTPKLKCPGTTGPKPYKIYTSSYIQTVQAKYPEDPCDTEAKPTKKKKNVTSSDIKNDTETSNKENTDDSCKEAKLRKKEKKRKKVNEEPEVESEEKFPCKILTTSPEKAPKTKKQKLTDSGEKSKPKKKKLKEKTREKPRKRSSTATHEEPLINAFPVLPSSTESTVPMIKKKKRKDCCTSEDNVSTEPDSQKKDSKKKKRKAEKNAEKQLQGETADPENSSTESPELILTHVLQEQLKQAREELEHTQQEKINLAEKFVDLMTKAQQTPDVRPASCVSDVAEMASPLVSAKHQGSDRSDSLPHMSSESPASSDAPTSDSKAWFRPFVPSQSPAESSNLSKDTGISLDSQSGSSILPTNISGHSSAGKATLHLDSQTGVSSAESSSRSSSRNTSGPSVLTWISEDTCSSFFGSLPSIQLLAQPCGLTGDGSSSGPSLPSGLNFYYEFGHSSACNRRLVVPPATPGYLLIPVGLRDSSPPGPGLVFTGSSTSSVSSSVNPPPVFGSAACVPDQVVSSSSASFSGHFVSSPLPASSQVSKPSIRGPRPGILSTSTSPSFRRTSFPFPVPSVPSVSVPAVSVPTVPSVSVPTSCNWSHQGAHKSIFQSALCGRRVETSVTFTSPPITSPVHTASSVSAIPSSCETAMLSPSSPDPSLTLLSSTGPLVPSNTPSNITINTASDVVITLPDGDSSESSTVINSLPTTSPGLDSSIASDLCQALTMTDSPGSKLSCLQGPCGETSHIQDLPAILPPAEGNLKVPTKPLGEPLMGFHHLFLKVETMGS